MIPLIALTCAVLIAVLITLERRESFDTKGVKKCNMKWTECVKSDKEGCSKKHDECLAMHGD